MINTVMAFVVSIVVSYLLGSVPTGLLLGKALGVDIRTSGSGNIGATNVYRTLGRTVGIMTLLGDCLKGLIPVLAASWLGFPDIWIAAAGAAAFFGHVFSVFLGFKGGKGVATALGVFIGSSPLSVLFAFVRIGTNARAFASPLTITEAAAHVQEWLEEPIVELLPTEPQDIRVALALLQQAGTGGNLTTDAQIAAAALRLGAVVHTGDTDYARFPKVRWWNPITGKRQK